MIKKLIKNKKSENFRNSVFVIILSITISMLAFVTENNKITGFVISEDSTDITTTNDEIIIPDNLMEFYDINSLAILAAGNYYIDADGIVYWIDDESRPAIAKVNFVDESQKNRHIYIDDQGRIGYVLQSIPIENEQ